MTHPMATRVPYYRLPTPRWRSLQGLTDRLEKCVELNARLDARFVAITPDEKLAQAAADQAGRRLCDRLDSLAAAIEVELDHLTAHYLARDLAQDRRLDGILAQRAPEQAA
jgi:hypothetical protein